MIEFRYKVIACLWCPEIDNRCNAKCEKEDNDDD